MKLKTALYARLIRNNLHNLLPNERTLNYMRYKLGRKEMRVDLHRISPVYVAYLVTNRCNLSCSFCVVGNILNQQDWRDREATVASTERIFEEPVVKRALYVMLTGGEPTINKDIVPIVQLLKAQGRIVAMTTNGHYLDQKADALIAARLDSINISLYPENFKQLQNVLPAVTPRVITKICKVITLQMLDDPIEIEVAADLAQSVGASGLYLANIFPTANAPIAQDDNIIFDRDLALYESVKLKINRMFPHLAIHWPAPAPLIKPPQKLCRMPWYFVTFDALGNIGMCCNSASCTHGNIYKLTPADVMNTNDWLTVRNGILSDGPVAELCRQCYLMNDRFGSDV